MVSWSREDTLLSVHSPENGDDKITPAAPVKAEHPGPSDGSTVVISFSKPDAGNPFDWSPTKKWITILTAELYSMATAMNAVGYGEGVGSMQRELHCSNLAATSGTASHLIVCAIAPLVLAPISEQFGRRYMMLISGIVFTLCYLPQALATDIALVIVFRGVQGAAASSANSLVGGVVADVFPAETRGFPMSIYALLILAGQGVGALVFGWVEMELGFRWIAWINMIIGAALLVAMYFLLVETRGSAILDARARALTRETGIPHIADTKDRSHTGSMFQLIRTTAARPIVFLLTEPVVAAMATWAALLWGVVFILFSAVPLIYEQYGFTVGQTGSVFATTIIGAILGTFAARYQDHLYDRDAKKTAHGRAPPESRLYAASVRGVLIPIALFWFAWSGRPSVHWIVPTLALVLFNFALFPIYLAVFSYLADSYEQYGSSAIAAQSFLRNVFAGGFPLFTEVMYTRLGYPQASSLLGALAFAFSVVPFLLIAYGPRIRKRSRVAKQIAWQQERRAAAAETNATAAAGCAQEPKHDDLA
ncbi:hypothetical protein PLICRDRAFT_46519 [Plicaturopsis crispa FD-325 SS-3]|uniref:Major facilitator superfamily (MFS) profile domain-containing protein n=1 Tax=Plicaturopsis crispa FD-325 SS-3 TaxID=944288 RepID=A0A0C9T7J7_PLICR|nr:hypothetical protein PLICRDRAFT_46519 [Plicaturopsis crispa FD-325 SS-3]